MINLAINFVHTNDNWLKNFVQTEKTFKLGLFIHTYFKALFFQKLLLHFKLSNILKLNEKKTKKNRLKGISGGITIFIA